MIWIVIEIYCVRNGLRRSVNMAKAGKMNQNGACTFIFIFIELQSYLSQHLHLLAILLRPPFLLQDNQQKNKIRTLH